MLTYRPDVDGLRAVAIVTVVAAHSGVPGWSGGYVGVDVFFVISGYLITSLLLAEAADTGRIDLPGFYARRIRRLLPAFATVLLATIALGAWLLGRLHGEQQGLARSALAALLLNSNHYFLGLSDGYFDPPAELQPLLHLWSLSLEEQYYLVWPPLLVALLAARRSKSLRLKVLAVLTVAVPVSLTLCIYLTAISPSAGFYLMPSRAWELALGGLLAVLPRPRERQRTAQAGVMLGWAGLGAIGAAVVSFDRLTAFPGIAATLPAFGAAAVIAGCSLAPLGPPALLLGSRPAVFVGLRSYSWYLWHWPLLAFARSLDLGGRSVSRDFLLGGVLGLGLAAVTYRWVESPVRQSTLLKRQGPSTTLRLGLALTLGGILAAGSLGAWAKYSPRSPLELRLAAAVADDPPLRKRCNNTLDQEARLPAAASCVDPAGSSRVDVVLWGDSMADHWMPAFSAAAQRTGRSVLQLTRDSCPPLLGFEIRHRDPAQAGRCLEFQEISVREIERLDRDQGLGLVVLSASWRLASEGPLGEALSRTLDRLERSGVQVLVLGPTPTFAYSVPDCLVRFSEARCAMDLVEFEAQRARLLEILRQAMAGRPSAELIDLGEILCNDKDCPVVRDGTILYRDAGHLTASGARSLWPAVSELVLRGDGRRPRSSAATDERPAAARGRSEAVSSRPSACVECPPDPTSPSATGSPPTSARSGSTP